MRNSMSVTLVLAAVLFLFSCNKEKEKEAASAPGPEATVVLRDGTRFAGKVTSSSPTQVTLAGEGANSRTFDMNDVKAIEYGTPAPTHAQAEPERQTAVAPPPASRQPLNPAPVPPARTREESPAPARTRAMELPVGTELAVRTNETIDSKNAAEGQLFTADVVQDVRDAAGAVVIPRGSNASVVIRSSTKGGRIKGASDLVLDLQSVSINGRKYELDTEDIAKTGKQGIGKNKRTAEYVGGGAAVGSIIGAIVGHGKGAAIGAASGAAAGAATQVFTRGNTIRVPAETTLTFRLDKPLRVYPSER